MCECGWYGGEGWSRTFPKFQVIFKLAQNRVAARCNLLSELYRMAFRESK